MLEESLAILLLLFAAGPWEDSEARGVFSAWRETSVSLSRDAPASLPEKSLFLFAIAAKRARCLHWRFPVVPLFIWLLVQSACTSHQFLRYSAAACVVLNHFLAFVSVVGTLPAVQ